MIKRHRFGSGFSKVWIRWIRNRTKMYSEHSLVDWHNAWSFVTTCITVCKNLVRKKCPFLGRCLEEGTLMCRSAVFDTASGTCRHSRHTANQRPLEPRPGSYYMENNCLSGNLNILWCDPFNHRLNMELDLQSLFGLLCIAVLISWDPATPPLPAHLGSSYEGAGHIDDISSYNPLPFMLSILNWAEPVFSKKNCDI